VVHHSVLRLVVSDGSVLHISPGHPTAKGEPLSALAAGQAIDDAHTLVSSELEAYEHARTYDILPASSTGSYFAAGVQLGSTLAPGH
jgi:hypothetical protein